MRKHIISQRGFNLEKYHQEEVIGISMTVPDETLTVRQIMQRHVTGMNLDTYERAGTYDSGASLDSDDLEKIQQSDLFEIEQKKNEISLFLKNNKAQHSRGSTIPGSAGQGASQHPESQRVEPQKADNVGSSEKSSTPPDLQA